MKTIEAIRIELDAIDTEMRRLFEARMALILEVRAYKKANNMPILDQNREEFMLNHHISQLENKELEGFYKTFLETVMHISKAYQL